MIVTKGFGTGQLIITRGYGTLRGIAAIPILIFKREVQRIFKRIVFQRSFKRGRVE